MKILYGVTGGVAATLAFKMASRLKQDGHDVEIVVTECSRYFWEKDDEKIKNDLGVKVWNDTDEWPNQSYIKDEPVRHIELRDWADLLLIAPLTANTLAKMANGFADNLLTCVVRAWKINSKKPIVVAPSMNTYMWEHPITKEHLGRLGSWHFNFSVVEPISKKLACGDVGKGALADIADIANEVNRWSEIIK